MKQQPINGQHHVSMLTKDAKQNLWFYTEVLGLRLVKKTVNQDDPSMYHLFYGNRNGAPGTEVSFLKCQMQVRPAKGRTVLVLSPFLFLAMKPCHIGLVD